MIHFITQSFRQTFPAMLFPVDDDVLNGDRPHLESTLKTWSLPFLPKNESDRQMIVEFVTKLHVKE